MKFRVLKLALKFVVALVVVAVVAGAYLFYRAMPAYSGSLALPGLTAETRVWRDGYGAPHIFAPTLDDAARALGYLHASERLYQMEIHRRAGQGRLAEVAGPDYVSVDRFIRTLGLLPAGQNSFAALSPWAQARLQAYADGVNAFLDSHRNALPPEFLHPRRQARAVDAGRLAGVGQADGAASQRQLHDRGPARARRREAAGCREAAGSSPRRSPIGRSPLRPSPARAMPSATARPTGSARCCGSATAPRTNGSSPARAP